jgi:hypothetical protein
MPAPGIIHELVERFDRNIEAYKQGHFSEAEIRLEYIDPFFKSLGWDVYNEKGYAAAYKEVVPEDAIKVGGATKAPDYSFRIGGIRKFFVEAKKPSVNLKDDISPAFQLRRYAWSAKLPLSILTDFEEFAVYDCQSKPARTDKASTSRVMYFIYQEYHDNWDEIAQIFSREAILKGSFDQYAESTRNKKGTAPVDTAFLKEIEIWREVLARNIALRNPNLTQRELNFSVQLTIDRIIFLRICEDRGIEPYGKLMALQNATEVYQRLLTLLHQADDRYNSGLFHFKPEKGRPKTSIDTLTPNLEIDDKVLKNILKNLYYPDSPYEFYVLPAEILGQVYEQFLGKVIRLTPSHRAKVEDKPEIKKAGGVYYTPTYIVDYIVKQTVGRLLEDKKAGPRASASKLKILDPACGSGSFLIGAYQHLLDWHLEQYIQDDPEKHARGRPPRLRQGRDGDWKLTIDEKKRILLNNIYGVDIDAQAVEVTKLSLLLKVLEGESEGSMRQLEMFATRALPDLGDNIKCGNSLIGPDIYMNQKMALLGEEEKFRINAFNWKAEFSEIMGTGGFDIVLGNPPYRRELDYKHLMDEIAISALGKKFRAPRMDLWYYFVHRGLELLCHSGILGFIVNSYWTSGTGAKELITALRDTAHIDEIFFFGKLKIFQGVSGQHMILLVSNSTSTAPAFIKLAQKETETEAKPFVEGRSSILSFYKNPSQLFIGDKVDIQPPADDLLMKIETWVPLGKMGVVRQGIAENPASINLKTNKKYGNRWNVGQGVFALQQDELNQLNLPKNEEALLRPYYTLSDIGRYYIAPIPSLTLIYSTRDTCPDINAFPTIRDHLSQFQLIMKNRRETRKGSNSWWHLHWPRDENLWKSPKILSVQMAERPIFVPVAKPVYVSFSVNVFVPHETTKENLYFITALLNSRLMWKWYKHNAKQRGVGLEINGNVLSKSPIRKADFHDPKEKAQHDKIVFLVERMLKMHKDQMDANTPQELTVIQREIDAIDKQIDDLVYKLYNLTDEEINTIETAM